MKSAQNMNRVAIALSLLLLGTLPSRAEAQVRAPSGVTVAGSGYWAPTRLGGSQGLGLAGALVLGVSPAVSLEASWAHFSNILADDTADPRTYSLDMPALSLRARIIGRDNGLALIFGGGALVHRLEASGGSAKETRTVPFFAPGFALRQRVRGPVYFDLVARTPMIWARDGELGATPGRRGFGLGGELRVGFSLLRRATPPVSQAMPIDVGERFQPVEAASVQSPASVASQGADFTYIRQGQKINATPATGVSVDEFNGNLPPVEAARGAPDAWIRRHLTTIFFDEGEAVVREEYRNALRQLAQYLKDHPALDLELVGFTENRQGRNQTKQQVLAEQRGTAIKELLVRIYGVEERRISVSAVGADFDTPEAALARRVDALAKMPR